MTHVFGKIESLKQIRSKLEERGIKDFNSIKEINSFIQNFESKCQNVNAESAKKVNSTIKLFNERKNLLENQIQRLRQKIENSNQEKINILKNKITYVTNSNNSKFLSQIFMQIKTKRLRRQLVKLELESIKQLKTDLAPFESELKSINSFLHRCEHDKSKVVREYSSGQINKLKHIKTVLEEINHLIAGAIGEHKVHQELLKLSDTNYLFNDYTTRFDPPIYNKQTKERILSIQLDHLLITKKGVFIIETKNWSKESLKNFDLRSPVEQIKRSSYAIFTLLNGVNKKNLKLEVHPWGEKKIQVKSIIVFVGEKPKEQFKYVKILSINELNNYLNHFDSIYDIFETAKICTFLKEKSESQY